MFGLFKKKNQSASPGQADLELLVPLVKAIASDVGRPQEIVLPPGIAPIVRPLVADLIIMYAVNRADRFEFVSENTLAALGIDRDELHSLALQNLPNQVPPIEIHGSSPRYMVTAGGNFEATLLLHDALWNELAERLPGDPMAVAPARDLLFVSGAGWDGAQDFLRGVANQELEDKHYELSKCILRRQGGQWHSATISS